MNGILLLEKKDYCQKRSTFVEIFKYTFSILMKLANHLKNKTYESTEPGVEQLIKKSKIHFTISNQDVISHCDFIYVMVPTPSTDLGDYDISAVEEVIQDFIDSKTPVTDKILVIGCTIYSQEELKYYF